jgi:hypothetical protein
VADRDQPELEGGDDPKAAAATTKGPEEIRLVLLVGAEVPSVGSHELDRFDVARGESVLPAEPAEAAAERVADDPDIGRGTRERGEPMLRGRFDELL